jgi:electron transfer flavoprotein alpha subunit
MKTLLVGECREGRLSDSAAELFGFANLLGAESAMVLVGASDDLPCFEGRLYFADAREYGEYNPEVHKRLVLKAVELERPDAVVFMHSSYGWDLAPRIAAAMRSAQVSSVTGIESDGFMVECCNGKMRRTVRPLTPVVVLTLQPGAFSGLHTDGVPDMLMIEADMTSPVEFVRYEPPPAGGVDLSRAAVIVGAGRGVGKKEHVELIRELAAVFGGEVGASRPVIDAGWLERSRQIGTTGQSVSPALYVACGISGAIQHLAGMKGSGFVLAVNTDPDAPIGELADLFVVADLVQFLPVLTAKLQQ